jgi:hypothetical protein
MKKVIMATLTFVATFALVAGVAVNGSAQATVLGKTDPTTSKPLTYVSGSHWAYKSGASRDSTESDAYVFDDAGLKNRRLDITATNSNIKTLWVIPVELTGSGSFDDYFDCNGNEVTYISDACVRQIDPNQTIEFTVKLADSSWWKDRDGAYLSSANPGGYDDSADFNGHVSYTMSFLG